MREHAVQLCVVGRHFYFGTTGCAHINIGDKGLMDVGVSLENLLFCITM